MPGKTAAATLVLFCLILSACSPKETTKELGFSPPVVEIGSQVWTKVNYHPSLFASAPPTKGIAYNNDPALGILYGNLLTHREAVEACPPGWHLPALEEWLILFDRFGGSDAAGGSLKTLDHWKEPNAGASDSSGFSALPSGGSDAHKRFDGLGWAAHFWSSTVKNGKVSVPSLMHDKESVYVLELDPAMRASVRYLKDSGAGKTASQELTIPRGKGVVIDGVITGEEWGDARKIEIVMTDRENVQVWAKHDQSNLLLMFDLPESKVDRVVFPEVLIDAHNDKSDAWTDDDWWFHVSGTDCSSKGKARNYDNARVEQEDWFAVPNFPTEKPGVLDVIEIAIPFAKVGIEPGKQFGFAVLVTNTKDISAYWPWKAELARPLTWSIAVMK